MKVTNKDEYNNLLKKIQDGDVLDEEKEKELKDVDQELIDMYNDFDRWFVGGLAIWWMHQTHNLAKASSILATPIDRISVIPL